MVDYLPALFDDPSAWVALATLVVVKVALGIDNLIFISVQTNKLPETHRKNARPVGVGAMRPVFLMLLCAIVLLVPLESVVPLFGSGSAWCGVALVAAAMFLVGKVGEEIQHIVHDRWAAC